MASLDTEEQDRQLTEQAIYAQILLMRLSASKQSALLALLAEVERRLATALASSAELKSMRQKSVLDFLASQSRTISQQFSKANSVLALGDIAQVIADKVAKDLVAVAPAVSAAHGAAKSSDGVANGSVSSKLNGVVTLSPAEASKIADEVLIQGAPSAEWWSRQAGDIAFQFANAVRAGIAHGKTNAQIVKDVRDNVLTASARNVDALVRSSVLAVANAARDAMYYANADMLRGRMQISTLDSRTSLVCVAYSGASWNMLDRPIDGNKLPFNGGPPRHWNCRSVLVPLLKSATAEPGFHSTTRASMNGPVRGGITFAAWLHSQPPALTEKLLGAGRAQLWRDGKLTLSQMLDFRGQPLTLAELKSHFE